MPTTTLAMNGLAGVLAAAGVALASFAGYAPQPGYDGALEQLTRTEAASYSSHRFDIADRDGDGALSVDEFAALSIVTAELAGLNGFVSVATGAGARTIPVAAPRGSLSPAEHARIDSVARHTFYAFAEDSRLDKSEFMRMQAMLFAAADRNRDGSLRKTELNAFADQMAQIQVSA